MAASHITAALASVEAGGGDAPLVWVATASAAALARVRSWTTNGAPLMADNRIAGYPVVVLGGCSGAHLVFGRWQHYLVIEVATGIRPRPGGTGPAALLRRCFGRGHD